MAKEKLFIPEDFDKEPKAPKNNYKKWFFIAIIVMVAIVAMVLGLKGCKSDNQSQNTESPQPTVATSYDSTAYSVIVVESDSADTNVSQINKPSINDVGNKPSEPGHEQAQNITISSDIEVEALKVIRGDYGNNPKRKSNLGDKYQSIQNRVNELKQEGVF